MTVLEAHNIAQAIENKVKARLPNVTVVTHIEPDTMDMTSEPDTEIRHPALRRVRVHSLRLRRKHR
jgi:divalent metal cation (Fe/Co/Zn/Cd) transporter